MIIRMFGLYTYFAYLHTPGFIKISQTIRGHRWKRLRNSDLGKM